MKPMICGNPRSPNIWMMKINNFNFSHHKERLMQIRFRKRQYKESDLAYVEKLKLV